MRRLAEFAKKHSATPTFVGYNFRHATSYRRLINAAQRAGGVRDISLRFLTNKPATPLWDYSTVFESYLYAIAIHPIEIAISLVGLPVSITSATRQTAESIFELELQLRGLGGRSATLILGNGSRRFTADFVVQTPDTQRLARLPQLEPRKSVTC